MDKPDLLIFFSDQHHAYCAGYTGHEVVRTPNLDRIAGDGTAFTAAYTACPLCVPARSAFLTGQLPSHTNVFRNQGCIPSDHSTFLHSLAAEGYETVLCGRMHFVGPDQRHGFTRRIMGDITGLYMGRGIKLAEWGVFDRTFGMGGCVDLVGGGNSPVLAYDEAVIEAALDYLSRPHEKPQCIVVGTYAPHFPYVAPPDLYREYRESAELPASWQAEKNYEHPVFDGKRQPRRHSVVTGEEEPLSDDIALGARAAYYGMITRMDEQIGAVREAWGDYLRAAGRDGVFVYVSDHGDTCGEHGVFGKQTFYDGSAAIPLVFEGSGVGRGAVLDSPVSIMDVGVTLCDLAGVEPPPAQDGRSLLPALADGVAPVDRAVLSEWVQRQEGDLLPGRMVRQGRWKFITFNGLDGADLLFDMLEDPDELHNLAVERTDVAGRLKETAGRGWEPDRVRQRYAEKSHHIALVRAWDSETDVDENEAWQAPPEACTMPAIAE